MYPGYENDWWGYWPRAFAGACELAASGPDDITRRRRKNEWERESAEIRAYVEREMVGQAMSAVEGYEEFEVDANGDLKPATGESMLHKTLGYMRKIWEEGFADKATGETLEALLGLLSPKPPEG